LRAFARKLERFWFLEFLGESLEKGNTRKHTRKRVTRWKKMFGGILGGLRCFAKRNLMGESEFGVFWGFPRGSTWACWGGGTISVSFVCLREYYWAALWNGWGGLKVLWEQLVTGELLWEQLVTGELLWEQPCEGWAICENNLHWRGVSYLWEQPSLARGELIV
jgi:hypothetical protein